MVTEVPSQLSTKTGPSSVDTIRARRRRSEKTTANATAVGAAFDAVIRAAQSVSRAGRETDAKSAVQMFEPPSDGDRAGNTGRVSGEQKAGVELADSGKFDRTSVAARTEFDASQLRTSRSPSESQTTPGLRQPPPDGVNPAADMALSRGAQSSANSQSLSALADLSDQAGRGPSPSVSPAQGDVASTLASSASVSSVSSVGPAGSVSSAGTAGSADSSSPAARVGQILASGRGGGEGVRAASAPAPGNAANNPSSARSQFGRSNDPQLSRPDGTPGATPSAGTEVSRPERSPFDELVRSIRLRGGPAMSSAKIQLRPPELGRLDVDVRVVGDTVRIQVRTESEAARKLVRENAEKLTGALREQGVTVEQFDVTFGLDASNEDGVGDGQAQEAATNLEGGRARHDGSAASTGPSDSEPAIVSAPVRGRETLIDIRV